MRREESIILFCENLKKLIRNKEWLEKSYHKSLRIDLDNLREEDYEVLENIQERKTTVRAPFKIPILNIKFRDQAKLIIMQEKKLEEIINELPEDLRKELEDFAQFLWEKNKKRKIRRKPKFDWAGSLSDLANDFSSVELQHKISDWRIGKK